MIRRRACRQGEAAQCVQLLPHEDPQIPYNADDIFAIIWLVTPKLCGIL